MSRKRDWQQVFDACKEFQRQGVNALKAAKILGVSSATTYSYYKADTYQEHLEFQLEKKRQWEEKQAKKAAVKSSEPYPEFTLAEDYTISDTSIEASLASIATSLTSLITSVENIDDRTQHLQQSMSSLIRKTVEDDAKKKGIKLW